MKKSLILPLLVIMLLSACKDEQSSGIADIKSMEISGINPTGLMLDTVIIDASVRNITLLFKNDLPMDSFPLTFNANYSITEGSKGFPASGEQFTLDNPGDWSELTLTAENGTALDYYIVVRGNQIPNSGFEDWYSTEGMNGASYNEPGKHAQTTVWSTANYGTSIYGVYCTVPVAEGENTLVRITTGTTSMIPITAGTLFTGKFDINGAIRNPANPREAVLFGIPFRLRPVALKFSYTYEPGDRYIKATLNNPSNLFGGFTVEELEGEDMFTAYAVLEIHEGAVVTEIARAEMISGEIQKGFMDLTLPFIYTNSRKPTHITVVFTSSKDGDLYTGAVGSTLTVDNVELIY